MHYSECNWSTKQISNLLQKPMLQIDQMAYLLNLSTMDFVRQWPKFANAHPQQHTSNNIGNHSAVVDWVLFNALLCPVRVAEIDDPYQIQQIIDQKGHEHADDR